jgi:adenosine deaminase
MRIDTLLDLAVARGVRLPDALTDNWPPHLHATDERGWFRFQRLYDLARSCVRGEEAMRRVVAEAAADDAAEGSRWLELQVEPSSYAPHVGGLTPALEIVLDAAREASIDSGIGVGIVVAASRIRHPLDARTLARLAARYAGDGPGTVVGFGLSNDERRGATADFASAFDIARRAGLALVPHGGELLGPTSVQETLGALRPDRLGHGVRSVEDPRVLDEVAEAGVALEVCPGSNLAMGVYATPREVPLLELVGHGIPVALGADDPLLFGSRLVDQYTLARDALGCSDRQLADLARDSLRASRAPEQVRLTALRDVDAWLARW